MRSILLFYLPWRRGSRYACVYKCKREREITSTQFHPRVFVRWMVCGGDVERGILVLTLVACFVYVIHIVSYRDTFIVSRPVYRDTYVVPLPVYSNTYRIERVVYRNTLSWNYTSSLVVQVRTPVVCVSRRNILALFEACTTYV